MRTRSVSSWRFCAVGSRTDTDNVLWPYSPCFSERREAQRKVFFATATVLSIMCSVFPITFPTNFPIA